MVTFSLSIDGPAGLYVLFALYGLIIAYVYDRAPLSYIGIAFIFAIAWTCVFRWLSKRHKLGCYIAWFLVLSPYIGILCDKFHIFFMSYYIQKMLALLRLQGVLGKPASTLLSTNLF